MREILISLAIQLEEKFRVSICYFDRVPPSHAVKSDLAFVLHSDPQGQIALEVFRRKGTGSPEDLATAVFEFLDELKLQIDPARQHSPFIIVSFANGGEAPTRSNLQGFSGFAFTTQILYPSQTRRAA